MAGGHAGRALSLIETALAIDPAHDTLLALREKVEKEAAAAESPRELRRRMSSRVRLEDLPVEPEPEAAAGAPPCKGSAARRARSCERRALSCEALTNCRLVHFVACCNS